MRCIDMIATIHVERRDKFYGYTTIDYLINLSILNS
jgi:hypothetical protein